MNSLIQRKEENNQRSKKALLLCFGLFIILFFCFINDNTTLDRDTMPGLEE